MSVVSRTDDENVKEDQPEVQVNTHEVAGVVNGIVMQ